MNLRDLYERLVFYLSVPKCTACNDKLDFGIEALCPKCYADFKEICTRDCSVCGKVLSRCTCSNEYLEKHRVKVVIKAFRYIPREENLSANSLIYSLKRDGRRDVLKCCTDLLTDSITAAFPDLDNNSSFIFTNVPRRRAAIVANGLDHAEELSRSLSAAFSVDYKSVAKSKTKKAQRMVDRAQRKKNVLFVPRSRVDLKGKTVIIVDDVITTGASVAAMADLCYVLGAKRVVAACLAIAYRDKYTPPIPTFY